MSFDPSVIVGEYPPVTEKKFTKIVTDARSYSNGEVYTIRDSSLSDASVLSLIVMLLAWFENQHALVLKYVNSRDKSEKNIAIRCYQRTMMINSLCVGGTKNMLLALYEFALGSKKNDQFKRMISEPISKQEVIEILNDHDKDKSVFQQDLVSRGVDMKDEKLKERIHNCFYDPKAEHNPTYSDECVMFQTLIFEIIKLFYSNSLVEELDEKCNFLSDDYDESNCGDFDPNFVKACGLLFHDFYYKNLYNLVFGKDYESLSDENQTAVDTGTKTFLKGWLFMNPEKSRFLNDELFPVFKKKYLVAPMTPDQIRAKNMSQLQRVISYHDAVKMGKRDEYNHIKLNTSQVYSEEHVREVFNRTKSVPVIVHNDESKSQPAIKSHVNITRAQVVQSDELKSHPDVSVAVGAPRIDTQILGEFHIKLSNGDIKQIINVDDRQKLIDAHIDVDSDVSQSDYERICGRREIEIVDAGSPLKSVFTAIESVSEPPKIGRELTSESSVSTHGVSNNSICDSYHNKLMFFFCKFPTVFKAMMAHESEFGQDLIKMNVNDVVVKNLTEFLSFIDNHSVILSELNKTQPREGTMSPSSWADDSDYDENKTKLFESYSQRNSVSRISSDVTRVTKVQRAIKSTSRV